jgi:hypothetical protein
MLYRDPITRGRAGTRHGRDYAFGRPRQAKASRRKLVQVCEQVHALRFFELVEQILRVRGLVPKAWRAQRDDANLDLYSRTLPAVQHRLEVAGVAIRQCDAHYYEPDKRRRYAATIAAPISHHGALCTLGALDDVPMSWQLRMYLKRQPGSFDMSIRSICPK